MTSGKEAYFEKAVFTLVLMSFPFGQMQCILPNSAAHRQVSDVLQKVLLHQDFPRCSSMDMTYQRLICEIWEEPDESSLQRLTCLTSGCTSSFCTSSRGSLTPCSDGSLNKTCLPHDEGNVYTCACYSVKQPNACPDAYQWDSEWRDITSGRQGLFRQLCDQTTQQCVATEYLFGVAHLVKYTSLSDENISASSEWDSRHAAKRARLDNYFDAPCGWVQHFADPDPYVQFNFPQIYVVLGVLIRPRCDYYQKATKINVRYSLDNAVWNYTSPLDVYPQYGHTVTYADNVESFTYFFKKAISGQYWRIYGMESLDYVGMKADIIGRV